MCRLSALTILVSQVQVCSCFDEQLDARQLPHGAYKVEPAACHSNSQHSKKELSVQGCIKLCTHPLNDVNPVGHCTCQQVPSPVLIYGVCQHTRAGTQQFPDLLHVPLQTNVLQIVLRYRILRLQTVPDRRHSQIRQLQGEVRWADLSTRCPPALFKVSQQVVRKILLWFPAQHHL